MSRSLQHKILIDRLEAAFTAHCKDRYTYRADPDPQNSRAKDSAMVRMGEVIMAIESGAPVREILVGNFQGDLLKRLLKAAGERKPTQQEYGGNQWETTKISELSPRNYYNPRYAPDFQFYQSAFAAPSAEEASRPPSVPAPPVQTLPPPIPPSQPEECAICARIAQWASWIVGLAITSWFCQNELGSLGATVGYLASIIAGLVSGLIAHMILRPVILLARRRPYVATVAAAAIVWAISKL